MLKIYDLRQAAYASWELLCGVKGVHIGAPPTDELPEAEAERLPWTNPIFKAEIRRRYGDTRLRRTWEEAAIDLTAHQVVYSYLEPYQIVGYMASPDYMQCEIREHYGEQVVERIWQFPETAEIVRAGLNQVYGETAQPTAPDIAQAFLTRIAGSPSESQRLPGQTAASVPASSRLLSRSAIRPTRPTIQQRGLVMAPTGPLKRFRPAGQKAVIYRKSNA